MRFEVNIDKKYFFISLVVGLIFIGIIGVIAYGTYNPQFFGHSVGEINWDEAIPGNVTAAGFCIVNSSGTYCGGTGGGGTTVNNFYGTGVSKIIAGNSNIQITSTGVDGTGNVTISATGGSVEGITSLNGNVGIGTANPLATLHIRSTGITGVKIETTDTSGSNQAALELVGGSANAAWSIMTNRADLTGAADNLAFYKESGTTGAKIVITNSGNVGIGTGTAALAAKLDVNGNTGIRGNLSMTGRIVLTGHDGSDGDIIANYNVWGTCHNMTWTAGQNVLCSNGEYVAGMYYTTAAGFGGNPPASQGIKCCKL